MEDVADHAVALLEMELAIVGDDTGGVLAPVLQQQQTVIEILNDITVAGDCNYAAHMQECCKAPVARGATGRIKGKKRLSTCAFYWSICGMQAVVDLDCQPFCYI